MTMWLKVLIPVALAVLAGWLNWQAATSTVAPHVYVKVTRSLKPGEKFSEGDLVRAEIRGDAGSLRETAVPWSDQAVLYQRPTSRALDKGDLVLWRDATPAPRELELQPGELALHLPLQGISGSLPKQLNVGDAITFCVRPVPEPGAKSTEAKREPQYLGPFRVVAVGSRLGRDEIERGDTSASEITLAVKRRGDGPQLDEAATRLLIARLSEQSGTLSIVVDPAQRLGKVVPAPPKS